MANNVSWNRGLLEANMQTVAEKNIVKRKEAKVPEKQRSTLQKKRSVWLHGVCIGQRRSKPSESLRG